VDKGGEPHVSVVGNVAIDAKCKRIGLWNYMFANDGRNKEIGVLYGRSQRTKQIIAGILTVGTLARLGF
jgi:hypothetical protein